MVFVLVVLFVEFLFTIVQVWLFTLFELPFLGMVGCLRLVGLGDSVFWCSCRLVVVLVGYLVLGVGCWVLWVLLVYVCGLCV